VAILSTVEVNVGVCCACMPVMYPLFRTLVGRRAISKAYASGENPRYAYGKDTSRVRQRLGSSDRADQLWSTSGDANGLPRERSEIPTNGIMVTHDLSVLPSPREEQGQNGIEPW
jgi:hypothetical protein